jgi:cobalt/nickel transport system permease protein
MLEEREFSEKSFVAQRDPRCRIVVASLFAILAALAQNWLVLLVLFCISVCLAAAAKLPAKVLFKRLLATNTFLLVLWVILPFTYGGESVLVMGKFHASIAGIFHAARVTLKANAIVASFAALVGTCPTVVIGHALRTLGLPAKFVYLLLFTARYVETIGQEYRRLFTAALVRGFKPDWRFHTYRTYAYLVGMLLVRSLARSQRIYEAMLCRGFQSRFYSLHQFRFNQADGLCVAVMLAGMSVLAYIEWMPVR